MYWLSYFCNWQLLTLDMATPPGCDGLHSIIICTLFCTTFPLLRTQEAGAGQQRNRANFAHISQQVRSAGPGAVCHVAILGRNVAWSVLIRASPELSYLLGHILTIINIQNDHFYAVSISQSLVVWPEQKTAHFRLHFYNVKLDFVDSRYFIPRASK